MTTGMSAAVTWARSSSSWVPASRSRSCIVYGCPFFVRNSRMRSVPWQCVDPRTTTSLTPRLISSTRRRMNARMKMSLSSASVWMSASRSSRSTSMTSLSAPARIWASPGRPESIVTSPVNIPGPNDTTTSSTGLWRSTSMRPATTTKIRAACSPGCASTSPCSTWRRRPRGAMRSICAGVSVGYRRSARGAGVAGEGGATSVMDSRALLVRFHKPEPLVHPARDLGENVGAACVLELVHLLDAEPHRAPEAGKRVRQRRHVLRTGGERQRIVNEGRPSLNDAHGPFGDAAELDDSLGDQIHVRLDVFVDLVKQLVERDERGAFHVPVSLLALCLQVDAVGEALIEQPDRLEPPGLRQIVFRRIGLRRRSGGGSHWQSPRLSRAGSA